MQTDSKQFHAMGNAENWKWKIIDVIISSVVAECTWLKGSVGPREGGSLVVRHLSIEETFGGRRRKRERQRKKKRKKKRKRKRNEQIRKPAAKSNTF